MKEDSIPEDQIFAVIKNHLVSSYPPETKITYTRLLELGFDEMEAKKMIGQCLSIELIDALQNKTSFDRNRYVRNLNLLPRLP